jgi:hypothetical protein
MEEMSAEMTIIMTADRALTIAMEEMSAEMTIIMTADRALTIAEEEMGQAHTMATRDKITTTGMTIQPEGPEQFQLRGSKSNASHPGSN